jgi:hypothetical protein
MKKICLKQLFTITLATLLMIGCANSPKQTKETKSAEKNVSIAATDTANLKGKILEIVTNTPKGYELIDMLKNSGASYIIDLTLPIENSEKMISKNSKSLGIGFYAVDTKYAAVYNRGDIELKINKVLRGFVIDLGIGGEFEGIQKLNVRIANNQSNKDSVKILTNLMFNEVHRQMSVGTHSKIYGLSIMGANVEALYILTQICLYAHDNYEFLELMSNQKERVSTVYKLLEVLSIDETIKPYFENMKPIMQFFEENKVIGDTQLKVIAPQIAKLRNSMI